MREHRKVDAESLRVDRDALELVSFDLVLAVQIRAASGERRLTRRSLTG